MTSDVHALLGAFAVDAVDDLERAAFERHLAVCDDCTFELASLREGAAPLAALEPVTPPDRLREAVLAGIGSVRPLPPEVARPDRQEVAPSRRGRFRPRSLVAAAAAVIALGGGSVVWQQVAQDDTSQAPSASTADRVRAAEDAEEYTQDVGGVEVTVMRSRSLNRAVLLAPDMPAAPRGKVYELWLDHGDGMVPAGVMSGEEDEVVFTGDPATAVGAAITIEPGPDGSKAPTSPAMMSFTFEKA